jgi:hypothetical protein
MAITMKRMKRYRGAAASICIFVVPSFRSAHPEKSGWDESF